MLAVLFFVMNVSKSALITLLIASVLTSMLKERTGDKISKFLFIILLLIVDI